ncbi:acetylneuraminate cytidylyltransferase [Photobacterium makurazakiensis]|uniref:PseG/SpsG family protein n=1 Tax=Photobacterium makurazakiensis TaxID=2910234 RepID=UPI003D098E51
MNLFRLLLAQDFMINTTTTKKWEKDKKYSLNKKVVFVVKGIKGKGLGHCFRAWTIAQSLPAGIDRTFILSPNSHLGVKFFKQKLEDNVALSDNDEDIIKKIIEAKPKLVINDILNTEPEYIKTIKKMNIPVINFEDIGLGSLYADCVINAVYSDSGNHKVLFGKDYADIRKDFVKPTRENINKNPTVSDILISFGGEDPTNLTQKTLNIIAKNPKLSSLHYYIALGPSYQHQHNIEHFVKTKGIKATIIVNQDIAPLMTIVDMAITANCRTVFETAFMCLPTVVISANERECLHTFYREAMFPYCGNGQLVNDAIIENNILKLAYNADIRQSIVEKLFTMDLSKGMERIIGQISKFIGHTNGHQPLVTRHLTHNIEKELS